MRQTPKRHRFTKHRIAQFSPCFVLRRRKERRFGGRPRKTCRSYFTGNMIDREFRCAFFKLNRALSGDACILSTVSRSREVGHRELVVGARLTGPLWIHRTRYTKRQRMLSCKVVLWPLSGLAWAEKFGRNAEREFKEGNCLVTSLQSLSEPCLHIQL